MNWKHAMNIPTHKGDTSRFEYAVQDKLFVGRMWGLCALASLHGEIVDESRMSLEAAIEGDLGNCSLAGSTPEIPVSGKRRGCGNSRNSKAPHSS